MSDSKKRPRAREIVRQDLVGAALEALCARHDGRLSPRIVLDEARDPSSPLHEEFVWDDTVAGEQYRLAQAAQLIRRWTGRIVRLDERTRRVSVQVVRRVQSPESLRGRGSDSYRTVEEIMRNPALRADLLATVCRELEAYRRRYAQLYELAEVWAAVDVAVTRHGRSLPPPDVGDRPAV